MSDLIKALEIAAKQLEEKQATITELTEVIERLASKELFLPLIQVMAGLPPQINWVKEFDARIEFAEAALKEKTDEH